MALAIGPLGSALFPACLRGAPHFQGVSSRKDNTLLTHPTEPQIRGMSFNFFCVVADLDPSIPANTWWTQLPLPLDEVLTHVERTGGGADRGMALGLCGESFWRNQTDPGHTRMSKDGQGSGIFPESPALGPGSIPSAL